ncbi:MAG: hypothetical protein JJU12_00050 [Chlamydiales bacterium]|nr:hypothetical protein [Chlamydiales bacterium]
MRLFFCFILLCFNYALTAETFSLTPPKGWDCINDPGQLPQRVSIIYIGAGKTQFTPSLNVATEPTDLPLDQYLSIAKSYHQAQGDTRCKQLGTVDTRAGKAQLLQIDRVTQWGNVRFIQAVLIRDKKAYVVTATCLQEEFSSLSSQIFKSIQSFTITQ